LGKEDNKEPLSLRCKRVQKEKIGPSIFGNGVLAEKGSYKASSHEVRQREGNEKAACIMERELTKIRQEWVCSQCGCPFDTPGCTLDGLTINEIMQHLNTMRGQTFAKHVCTRAANVSDDAVVVESVADILERELHTVIAEWLIRVEKEPDLMSIPMIQEERTGHLPQLLHDVVARLRLRAGIKAPVSKAAAEHGELRHKQGYTVAMAVQESRLLQVSIFSTLHKSVERLKMSLLLSDVATIADEVDAQLKEQMVRFMAEEKVKP
jgi:hypothetical protein